MPKTKVSISHSIRNSISNILIHHQRKTDLSSSTQSHLSCVFITKIIHVRHDYEWCIYIKHKFQSNIQREIEAMELCQHTDTATIC